MMDNTLFHDPDFIHVIADWNRARYEAGDIALRTTIGVSSWRMELAMFIWKRAKEAAQKRAMA